MSSLKIIKELGHIYPTEISKYKKNNITGYKNVYFNKRLGKWTSQIQYKKEQHFLGVFNTKKEAVIFCNKYIDDNNLPHTKNIIEDD